MPLQESRKRPPPVSPRKSCLKKPSASATVKKTQLKNMENKPAKRGNAIEFPDSAVLSEAHVCGSPEIFNWAGPMFEKLRNAGLEIRKCFAGFNLCTEFSGSGCPEAALTSVVNTANVGMEVKCQYSADIDATCRKVLSSSCGVLNVCVRLHHVKERVTVKLATSRVDGLICCAC